MKDDDYYTSDNMRKGKWTTEEENYSNKLIMLFNQGLLSIPPGTTLRSHLSEKLSCDPMRITKKFAGASCIGKQVFHPCDSADTNTTFRRDSIKELDQLEKIFLTRIQSKAAAQDRAHRYEQQLLNQRRHAEEVPVPIVQQSPSGRGVKNKHNPALDAPLPPPRHLQSPDSDAHTSNSTSFCESYIDSNRSSLSGPYQNDSMPLSSGVFQKNKRIMSAPDLTQLSLLASNSSQHTSVNNSGASTHASVSLNSSHIEDTFGIAQLASSRDGLMKMPSSVLFQSGTNGSRKSPAKLPKGKTPSSTTATRGGNLRTSTHGTRQSSLLNSNTNNNASSMSNVKKSHSMMDLGNYEKMAADDRAAGEMFFQFVQTLGDKYTDSRESHVMSSCTSGSRPLSVSSLTDHTLAHQSMFASSHHTTPSPNAASLILARQFMTIDDVISATVAEDFSSFSMKESAQFGVANESKLTAPSPYRPLPTLSDMSQTGSSSSRSTLNSSSSRASLNVLHCDSPLLLSAKMENTSSNGGMTLNSQEVTQQLASSSSSSSSSSPNDCHSASSSSVSGLTPRLAVAADIFIDQSLCTAEWDRQRLNSEEQFRTSEDNFF